MCKYMSETYLNTAITTVCCETNINAVAVKLRHLMWCKPPGCLPHGRCLNCFLHLNHSNADDFNKSFL